MNRSIRLFFVLTILLLSLALVPALAQDDSGAPGTTGYSPSAPILSAPHATEALPGDQALTLYLDVTVQGGVASGGVSLRGVGAGDITIAGIPAGATVEYAFLYWTTLTQVETTVTFDGNQVTGEHIGTSPDTCWGATSNLASRADVTAFVSGNGTYNVSGLPAAHPTVADTQGASLVVIYSDPAGDWVNIVIHDGSISTNVFGQMESTVMNYVPDMVPPSFAELTVMVGDGQTADTELWVDGFVFPGLFGTGDTSVVTWETPTFDVAAHVGASPVDVTIHAMADCVTWEAAVLAVSTPAPAYDTCNGYDATIWVDADGIIRIDEAYYGGLPVPGANRPYRGRIVGTDRPDIIAGTDDPDRIVGRAANDTICGYGGDDVILGQDGQDDIWAGEGNDRVNAGVAGDEVWGGPGDDVIHLGEGTDYAEGNEGMDKINGGTGQDEMYGGFDDDILNGHNGDDRMYGGFGEDTLRGGNGNDHLYGAADDDVLLGGNGDDWMYGGEGNDDIRGQNNNDWMYGEGGDDFLLGGNGDDRMYGGEGTDELRGHGNNDFMYGEAGDGDVLLGGNGDDRMDGGDGVDDRCIGQGGPHDYALGGCEITNASTEH